MGILRPNAPSRTNGDLLALGVALVTLAVLALAVRRRQAGATM